MTIYRHILRLKCHIMNVSYCCSAIIINNSLSCHVTLQNLLSWHRNVMSEHLLYLLVIKKDYNYYDVALWNTKSHFMQGVIDWTQNVKIIIPFSLYFHSCQKVSLEVCLTLTDKLMYICLNNGDESFFINVLVIFLRFIWIPYGSTAIINISIISVRGHILTLKTVPQLKRLMNYLFLYKLFKSNTRLYVNNNSSIIIIPRGKLFSAVFIGKKWNSIIANATLQIKKKVIILLGTQMPPELEGLIFTNVPY